MTLDAELVREGLRTLAEVNGRVKRGEDVVVVTDPEMEVIAQGIASAAADAGGKVTVCLMPMRGGDGQEPPSAVAAAMAAADVIFAPVRISI
ncbi:MAG: leucyl aminopeptidase, partial [Gemmatimonadetes bacterium]|nr:leucyl aminopeptidase [Gemmatimonadota bacterium]